MTTAPLENRDPQVRKDSPNTEYLDVPLFDLRSQNQTVTSEIDTRIAEVLVHGQYILGPEVAEFEKALSDYVGGGHAVGVSSGRDAIIMALMALGIGPGDAVFVPSFTFSATAGGVVAVGAAPVFVDVDPETRNICPLSLQQAIDQTRKAGNLNPKAVMPVDLYGMPADYAAIGEIAEAQKLLLIADAAQSFGAIQNGKYVGTLAPVSVISFYPTKPLGGFGDGGAVFALDEDVAEAVKRIRNHGLGGSGDQPDELGMTGRLDTLQAAVLLAKLKVFDDQLAERQNIAARYQSEISADLVHPVLPSGVRSAWAIYSVEVPDRDRVRESLSEVGVSTGIYYPRPLHHHPAFQNWVDPDFPLNVSEKLAARVLALPLHCRLNEAQIDHVIAAVNSRV